MIGYLQVTTSAQRGMIQALDELSERVNAHAKPNVTLRTISIEKEEVSGTYRPQRGYEIPFHLNAIIEVTFQPLATEG